MNTKIAHFPFLDSFAIGNYLFRNFRIYFLYNLFLLLIFRYFAKYPGGKLPSVDQDGSHSGERKLNLQHFYSSLLCWLAGVTLAAISFAWERIRGIDRKNKQDGNKVFVMREEDLD